MDIDRPDAMYILVVDDDATNRFVLQTMLKKMGHTVCTAGDGQEAIEVFNQESPDMILMDVMMPRMDGLEATTKIKSQITDDYIPVIFLTALSDEQALAKCIAAGGDDFLTKPYKKDLLSAKLDAHIRLRVLQNTTLKQRDELALHNEREYNEQLFAKKIYKNMVHQGELDAENIKYSMSSMALFNGDVLFSAKTPSGKLHVMLGDFTGHGLSAAMGAVPLSSIFHTMTAKGFGISDIIFEMNRKLKSLLPLGIFCAACLYELDTGVNTLRAWNGGIPGAYICDKDNTEIRYAIRSSHAPLGILKPNEFDSSETVFDIQNGDKIYLCTDGVTEARNPEGEMFGSARLEYILINGKELGNGFEAIQNALNGFRKEVSQDDDMTFIEVTAESSNSDSDVATDETEIKSVSLIDANNTEWDLSLTLDLDTIKNVDPIPLLNQMIVDLSCNTECKQEIFLILSELISNSIDHGILGLDSKIKQEDEGFIKYYDLRKKKLDEISSGHIKVKIKLMTNNNDKYLVIRIIDSGEGFDYTQSVDDLRKNQKPSGRGIPLVNQLCYSVEYKGKGNQVEAIYRWKE